MKKLLQFRPNKSHLSKIWTWAKSPIGSTLLLSISFVTISLVCAYHVRAYNSDDLVLQNAMLHWFPFNGDTYYADGGVTYIIKMPLYWIVSLFVDPGRSALFLSSLVMSLLNFVAIYYSSLYFLRTAGIKITRKVLLPFLWLGSFGFALSQIFLSPNLHNLEVSAIFILLVVVSQLCRGIYSKLATRRKVILGILFSLFIGIMIVDDGYFIYFGLVPAVLLVISYVYKNSLKKVPAAGLLALLASGFIFAKIVTVFYEATGTVILYNDVAGASPSSIIQFRYLMDNILNGLHSLLIVFGADFFDRKVASGMTIITGLALLALGFVVFKTIQLLRTYNKKDASQELTLFALLFWIAVLIYTFSTLANANTTTYRYLVILPFIGALLLAAAQKDLKGHILTAILVFGLAANIGGSVLSVSRPAYVNGQYLPLVNDPAHQSYNYRFIAFLKTQGLQKGYANYWNANVNNYLSAGSVDIIPSVCNTQGGTGPLVWLEDKSRYLVKATTTFYVIDQTFPLCTEDQAIQQFGQPVRSVSFDDKITVLVYNYDLLDRMDQSGLK